MDIQLGLSGDAAAGISIPFIMLLLGWIVATAGRVRIARRQAEVWDRLIEKLDPPAVNELLTRDGGKSLEALLSGPDRPHARIIIAAQTGVVLFCVGLVLLIYGFARSIPTILGATTLALGFGLCAAAGVGYWLSSRWGLLSGKGLEPRRDA